jgi:hypothetical protein
MAVRTAIRACSAWFTAASLSGRRGRERKVREEVIEPTARAVELELAVRERRIGDPQP